MVGMAVHDESCKAMATCEGVNNGEAMIGDGREGLEVGSIRLEHLLCIPGSLTAPGNRSLPFTAAHLS